MDTLSKIPWLKTLAGAVIILIGGACGAFKWVDPTTAFGIVSAGIAIMGIGIRHGVDKAAAALLVCLLIPCLSFADETSAQEARDPELKAGDVYVPLALRARCRNRNGNCVWCSAEMAVVTAGYESFDGIFQNAVRTGWHGAGLGNVVAALKDAHIEYRAQFHNRDPQILYDAIKEGVPFYWETYNHAMIGVGIDDQTVRIIDNNGPPRVAVLARQEFMRKWTGFACYALKRTAKAIWKVTKGVAHLLRGNKHIGSWNPETQTYWAWDGKKYLKQPAPWEKP